MIEIPFNDWSTNRHEANEKTATTRTERYGNPGDRFVDEDAGIEFELTHVVKLPLSVVANYFYEHEGCGSKNEFLEVWKEIHYKKGYVADWEVWLHLYRRVGDV